MTPEITIVIDIDSTITPDLRAWNDPQGGVVAAMIRPGQRTTGWLATDLLTALGRISGKKLSADGWAVAAAHLVPWLVVENVKHLVIGYAETLPTSQLEDIVHLAHLAEVSVWFVSDAGTSDNLARFADDFGARTIGTDEFGPHLLATPGTAEQTTAGAGTSTFPKEVPDDAFLTFLATARRTMSDEAFAQVLHLFVIAFDDTRAWLSTWQGTPTEVDVAQHISEIVQGMATLSTVTTAMRAIQAAAFRHGLLIKLDPRRFLNRMTETLTALDLSAEDWRRLSENGNTRQCAIAVLASLGVPVTDIHTLTVDQVEPDASAVRAGGKSYQVPEAARPLLMAQLLYRACTGDPMDPLLLAGSRKDATYTLRGISLAIGDLTRATGIAFRALHDRWDSDSMAWRQRSGISITELAA